MKLESQVCSLELSKRLRDLGVKQESIFGWIYHKHSEQQAWACKHKEPNCYWYVIRGTDDHKTILWNSDKETSAFTVAELGEMLPGMITTNGKTFFITMDCDRHPYYVSMNNKNELYANDIEDIEDNDLEADARAKMLIYLLENKLMELPNE